MTDIKDPVAEFERIDNNLNEAISGFFKGLGKAFGSEKKPAPSSTSILDKHRQAVESGSECDMFGTKPHGLFYSQTGSPDAYFGRNRNYVKDIMDLQISKRELRCYDLEKDPKKIAWLFAPDVVFKADRIWGKPKKIYFQGIWKAGIFKGVLVEPSKFEGGEFHGVKIPTDRDIQQQAAPMQVPAEQGANEPQPQFLSRVPHEGIQTIKKMVYEVLKSQK